MRNRPKNNGSFREKIIQTSKNNFTKIILALDLQGSSSHSLQRSGRSLIEETAPYLCAVKIGRQTVLNLGTEQTKGLIKSAHANDLQCIIDDKLNDIDEVNHAITSAYFNMGFDGIIVNPIAGWKGGLEPVFRIARETGRGVITLVHMSHPGASDVYSQMVVQNSRAKPRRQYEIFAERAEEWGADGVVVGATNLEIVRRVRSSLNNGIHIYSPGIGTQGGEVIKACRAGSDFLIVGRSITRSIDPEKTVISFARQSMSKVS